MSNGEQTDTATADLLSAIPDQSKVGSPPTPAKSHEPKLPGDKNHQIIADAQQATTEIGTFFSTANQKNLIWTEQPIPATVK